MIAAAGSSRQQSERVYNIDRSSDQKESSKKNEITQEDNQRKDDEAEV